MRVICQGCGRRRVRFISRQAERKRKNNSVKHWRSHGSHGDPAHDLCRQCFKSIMEPMDVLRDVAMMARMDVMAVV